MGETTAMTLSTIVDNAGSLISAAGTNFATLNTAFGYVLYIPVTIVVAKVVIGMVKSILFFRRGRKGR